jgi:hypothetical protein
MGVNEIHFSSYYVHKDFPLANQARVQVRATSFPSSYRVIDNYEITYDIFLFILF